jgi:phosphate-selective porin OprO and OprP
VTTSYMLTGEARSQVGIVKPKHPFNPAGNNFGLGAWKVASRIEMLNIGSQVFTNGLADPNLWANRVTAIDEGFNGHMTHYAKLMFEWEHATFNQGVIHAPGKRQETSDLLLVRIQLFF